MSLTKPPPRYGQPGFSDYLAGRTLETLCKQRDALKRQMDSASQHDVHLGRPMNGYTGSWIDRWDRHTAEIEMRIEAGQG
jgi:hypothetical protein